MEDGDACPAGLPGLPTAGTPAAACGTNTGKALVDSACRSSRASIANLLTVDRIIVAPWLPRSREGSESCPRRPCGRLRQTHSPFEPQGTRFRGFFPLDGCGAPLL